MSKSIIDTLIEVRLSSDEDFLKIAETLTRIGVAPKDNKKLYQSCHILHKRGKYYVVHFKELYALDGKETDFSDEDKLRRNKIALLLKEWGLVEIVSKIEDAGTVAIKVIPFKEKSQWQLIPKYNIGLKKK